MKKVKKVLKKKPMPSKKAPSKKVVSKKEKKQPDDGIQLFLPEQDDGDIQLYDTEASAVHSLYGPGEIREKIKEAKVAFIKKIKGILPSKDLETGVRVYFTFKTTKKP